MVYSVPLNIMVVPANVTTEPEFSTVISGASKASTNFGRGVEIVASVTFDLIMSLLFSA